MRRKLLFLLIVLSNTAFANNKDDAFDAAVKAAKIQTGFSLFEANMRRYGENEAKKYASYLGVDKPIAAAAWGYNLYKNPGYTFKLSSDKTLSVTPNKLEFKLSF